MLFKLNKNQGLKIAIIAAIAFFLCTLSLTLNRHFSFYSSYDQGIFNQVFWNGIHGRFFESTLSSQLSTNVVHSGEVPDVNYHRLGQHFTPALLLWLPIYYLFPHPATLTVLQVTLVTAAGLVLYNLARIYVQPAIAVLITISFYCANTILGPTLANFHDISQIPLFIFSLLLAMEKRWWWLFWLLAILTLAVREDSGITLFGVGVYLVLSKRHPRTGLILASLSFLYIIALTNLIMPLFSDDISKRFMLERFGQYAEGEEASTLEIIKNMLLNPGRLIMELFTPFFPTIKYLLGQWLPLAFIPAVSPAAWSIATFPLLKLFLGQGQTVLAISLRYAMSVTPGLFYGAILWWGGERFGNFQQPIQTYQPRKLLPQFRRFWIICIVLSLFFTITSNPSRTLSFLIPDSIQPWVYVSLPEQWHRVPQIRSILKQIPPDASVSATTYLIPHLSGRRAIIRLTGLEFRNDAGNVETVDYIIADLWQLQRYQIAFDEDRVALQTITELIERVTNNQEYGIIDFNQGVILLQKGANSNPDKSAAWQNYRERLSLPSSSRS
ncbi:Protein of unknown function DUF2079, membrane [Stanieria cyanosphaera PCC 7437]|uniref:Uncharacterized protein n=1 Tax=Stanieria cyanosphaera (strain ATCC 29371 / PCC 7437) TaxID=111780 RepID=K9XZR7_STAC7|nr:DUF2079 domain-containing protein [Stanieria cyanosphaera]AFZ37611.1 Protein of unknown function DUF2079, membrane [Stanieria cyanosphaera PCC 7437]